MSFLGKVLGVVVDTVKVPIAVVEDVVTLGGVANGKNRTYTGKALEELEDDIRDL